MINSFNNDRTGWALFSPCMKYRYRLARSLDNAPLVYMTGPGVTGATMAPAHPLATSRGASRRCTFVMLNPSTANAFVPDPTVNECRKRAIALGANILEVVNLYAFRSPHRRAMFAADDPVGGSENDLAIAMACAGAEWIIAAWGNHPTSARPATAIRIIRDATAGAEVMCLARTSNGSPRHPLARGKHRIPRGKALEPFP